MLVLAFLNNKGLAVLVVVSENTNEVKRLYPLHRHHHNCYAYNTCHCQDNKKSKES